MTAGSANSDVPTDDELLRIYDRGYSAERNGLELWHNPYMPVSEAEKAAAWAAGFLEAEGPYCRVRVIRDAA